MKGKGTMDALTVKTLQSDHTLDDTDHFCILYFGSQANIRLEADSCSVGFLCFVICAAECGMTVAGPDVMVNGKTGGQAMRYFQPGVNILAQPEVDSWTLGVAQAG
jgi:hypothetical protein